MSPRSAIGSALTVLLLSATAFAGVGVGIGTGKIHIDAPLKPGTSFDLPGIPVLNTGSEPAEYGMSIQYHMDQPENRPSREWFSFDPATFRLDPKSSRVVRTRIALPVKVPPGDYFAYVQAQPQAADVPGTATVGVAAAAKLYFTVEPANALQGVYWRLASIMQAWAPWTTIVPIVLAAAVALKILGRFFSFNVGVRRR
jgi:hypothetical protein